LLLLSIVLSVPLLVCLLIAKCEQVRIATTLLGLLLFGDVCLFARSASRPAQNALDRIEGSYVARQDAWMARKEQFREASPSFENIPRPMVVDTQNRSKGLAVAVPGPMAGYDWINTWVLHNPFGWFLLGAFCTLAGKLVRS